MRASSWSVFLNGLMRRFFRAISRTLV